MYKSFTSDQYRKHLGFPDDYKVDGVLCYGTLYEDRVLNQLAEVIEEFGVIVEINELPHPFLRFAKEMKFADTTLWFAIGYGGAWLSEYLHWACMFGSKINILLGSCGGLKTGMKQGDFIVPKSSYGEESSVKIYNRESPVQHSDDGLSNRLAGKLGKDGTKVWRGATVTCQAMIGETMDDVTTWSKAGYLGVEMEASTVFAVSNHFSVPSAASLYVGDNLIEEHTNMSEEFVAEADVRKQNQLKQIKIALSEFAPDIFQFK
jgi:purine-nucleoside phosphorylase